MSDSKGKSESVFSKIFVGVAIAVISAVILSNMGLGGGNDGPITNPPQREQVQPKVEKGGWCCDTWGNKRCQLVSALDVGSSCFCPGQGYGLVCK